MMVEPSRRAQPGQFVTLKLRPDPGSSPLVRSYSLSGPPTAARYRISVKVEPQGAAGRHIRAHVQVGDRLEVGAPRGLFTLDDGDRAAVLISAGIGATPLLAMLHELHDERFDAARSGGSTARVPVPSMRSPSRRRSLVDELAHARHRIWYSRPGPTDRVGVDYDENGRITAEALHAAGVPLDGEFYMCGPVPFMNALREGLAALGVPPGHVHTEIFGAQGSLTPGVVAAPERAPHQPEGPSRSGPLVSFVRTALNVRWGDEYASILELAEACDVPVRWSCRTGVCHTCESGLLDGTVEYSPLPLEAPADGNVLVCSARRRPISRSICRRKRLGPGVRAGADRDRFACGRCTVAEVLGGTTTSAISASPSMRHADDASPYGVMCSDARRLQRTRGSDVDTDRSISRCRRRQARNGAVQPVADRAERVVVERVHLAGIDACRRA